MIIRLKEKMKHGSLILLLSGIFLFTFGSNAQEVSIQVGTSTRDMIIFAPAGIEQNRPLVISMHGMNQTMYDQKNQTQFESVAQTNNFVLVFPNAIDKSWQLWGTTDTDFILAIIDEMYNKYGIDRDRVYLSGFSMGGMMTYYAATQIADKIAAYAPVSGFLMGGPDTNSSRPIPIIHVHGADDNYVPHSRVQECLDAWIERNGNPVTPQVIDPYPANQLDSNSKKYYWGPGKEGVEIAFISVGGVGHWYSDNPNGVFTSQEIWDFCKNYTLKFGIPKFEYASVTDNNPGQIQVVLSELVADSNYFTGFTVTIDNQIVTIDSVVLGDTNQLVINLHSSIQKDNEIALSYSNGNVFSMIAKELSSFNDTLVNNLLKGASPRIIELATDEDGDTLIATFNMKMHIPADISALALSAEYNGQMSIPMLQGSFSTNDSAILVFSLGEQVYRDYNLFLSYTGNIIAAADSGLLKAFSNFKVSNISNGLPVHINTGILEVDGITLSLEFSKPMALESGQTGSISIERNGESALFNGFAVSDNFIKFTLRESVHHGDTVIISYTPGDIKAADNGSLEGFIDFVINSQINAPEWVEIPGKIEAEDYAFKYGMQTETTGDVDGGLNLGYIGDGDWLEYTIENNTSDTEYQIAFRLAATGTGGIIDFYIDNIKMGSVEAPNTGNWQVYKSVVKNISINQGKHYLKVVATKSGFNFNYIEIGLPTEIKKASGANTTIYPNPVSNELTISSVDFQHKKIEVFDIIGNLVINRATAGETELQVPINLPNGMYFVKISNEKKYQLKKIMVVN